MERNARWLVVFAVVLAIGCASPVPPREEGEGPGGRQQPLALGPKQELEIGRRAYAEVMQEFRGRIAPDDSAETVRARRVVSRLAQAAAIEPLQREINLRVRGYRFEWGVHVIRDDTINAFCLPAGKMFLFTGILKVIGDNEDFLATVLSHEMAHALGHHASERIARERGGGSVLRHLSYGRMQEAEADHIGVFLMAFAGYRPEQAAAFWERMTHAAAGKRGPPEWLSDHPSSESRIRDLRGWAPQARAAKKAFDSGRVLPPNR
jgi:predicted Zn-dependent protease